MNIDSKAKAAYIKNRVFMPDVIARYHHPGKRPGRTSCPFHGGEHDNLGYDQNVFHCFVCGAKGDVITFTQFMNGTDFPGALKLMDKDFGLGIEQMGDSERDALKNAQRAREAQAQRTREQIARTRKIFVLFTRVIRWTRRRDVQTPVHAFQIEFLERQTDFVLGGGNYTSDPKATARAVVQRVKAAEKEACHGV